MPSILLLGLLAAVSCGNNANPDDDPVLPELKVGDYIKNEGVVVYVDPINKKAGKIISLTYEKELQWCDLCERIGSLSSTDGIANTAAIRASKHYPENYPAMMYCDELGDGWYMPAVDEWKALYSAWNGGSLDGTNQEARDAFDAYLTSVGGAPLNPDGETTANGQSYWSSTEDAGSNMNAYYVRFGNYGSTAGTKKSQNRLTRCYKVIGTLTPAPTLTLETLNATLGSDEGSYVAIPYTSNKEVTAQIIDESAEEWLEVRVSTANIIFLAKAANEAKTPRGAYVNIIAGPEVYHTTTKVYVSQEEGIKQVSHLREVHDGGIVFWQNVENEKDVKIISLSRLKADKGWCTSTVQDVKCNADSLYDGVYNTNAIIKVAADNLIDLATNFFAVNYCKSMGEGWYLPAKNELLDLFAVYNNVKTWELASKEKFVDIPDNEKQARRDFEAILAKNGGDVFDSMGEDPAKNGDSYFSSTEDPDNVQKVFYLRVGSLDNVTQTKRGTARYVRCAKKITLE